MSSALLLMILIATPGLIFGSARRLISRSGVRYSRDTVRLIGEAILVSGPVFAFSILILNAVSPNLGYAVLADFFESYNGQCERGCALEQVVHRIFWFVLAVVGFAFVLGLVFQKIADWIQYPNKKFGTVADTVYGGLLPPVVEASILAVSNVPNGQLLYRGILEDIQIGPEGKIDYAILRDPAKSQLRDGKIVANKLVPSREPPKAIEPFSSIGGESGSQISDVEAEFLIIESEDLANVFLRVGGSRRGDWLDRQAYKLFGKKKIPNAPAEKAEEKPPSERVRE